MNDVATILKRIIEKCDIVYSDDEHQNCIISKEILIKSYCEYLASTISSPKKSVGVIMHTNSLCFDIITILFCSLINILNTDVSTEEIIDSLSIGNIVYYQETKTKRTKNKFLGKIDCDGNPSDCYVKLNNGADITYVRKDHWNSISPYYGDSQNLEQRGTRRKNPNCESFFVDVLDYSVAEIPSVFTNSTVIVMDKDKVDTIIKNTYIRFNNKSVKILDLVTATYYTENNVFPFGGNQTKADPILKFTSKCDVAFNLLRDNSNNQNIGFVISGKRMIKRGYTELERLINRRSVLYTYILTSMDSDYDEITNLINDEYAPQTFACTKEYLKSLQSLSLIEDNDLTRELSKKVDIIVNKTITVKEIKSSEFVDSKLFKSKLKLLKNNNYQSEIKDEFIIQSYSLWNFFQYSVFKMTAYNGLISKCKINAIPINERLERLKEIVSCFPLSLKKLTETILNQLLEAYKQVEKSFDKENELKTILKFAQAKSIAIIVYKSIYRDVLRDDVRFKGIDIFTPSDFVDSEIYDSIVIFGNYYGKNYDSHSCFSSPNIQIVLFDYESPVFNYRKRRNSEMISHINDDSFFPVNCDTLETDVEQFETAIENEQLDTELVEYINNIVINNSRFFTSVNGNYTGPNTEVVKAVKFGENECVAYFTKMYKAYCFVPSDEIVKEIGVENIREGNILVFTKNDSNTRDIIDRIIQELITSENVSEEIKNNYELAKVWKDTLRDYLQANSITSSKAAMELVKMGATVQEQTIKSWIDIDSHTVKPNDILNLKVIGEYTGNSDLTENAEMYFNACRVIYKLRDTIREEIKKIIIRKFGGNNDLEDSILSGIQEEIDSLYDILTVESVFSIKESIPVGYTNRPLNI